MINDYVKTIDGFGLSNTIELPGTRSSGFDLPTSRILPAVRETFKEVKEYQRYIGIKLNNLL